MSVRLLVRQQINNPIGVIDTAGPRAAAGELQRGPKPRVLRQRGIGREVFARGARRARTAAPSSAEARAVAHQINVP